MDKGRPMSSTIVELHTEALERQVKSIADHIGDSIKEPLAYRLKLLLKHAPVSITVVDSDGVANDVEETLNKRELAVIYSLIHFSAYNQNAKLEIVQERLEKHFSVQHIAHISRRQFPFVMEYMLEMHEKFLEEV